MHYPMLYIEYLPEGLSNCQDRLAKGRAVQTEQGGVLTEFHDQLLTRFTLRLIEAGSEYYHDSN